MLLQAMHDGGRFAEFISSYDGTRMPDHQGAGFAVTVGVNEATLPEAAHLRRYGMRPIVRARNPNTGHYLEFWWRQPDAGYAADYVRPMPIVPFQQHCCGLHTYAADTLPYRAWRGTPRTLRRALWRGLEFVIADRHIRTTRGFVYLGEIAGHHYYVGGKPCPQERD